MVLNRAALFVVLALLGPGCRPAAPLGAPHPATCERLVPGTPGLQLVVLGSGGPASTGRAASGYLVLVDGVARALVDVGPGTFLRLGELGVDLAALEVVLLTHLHVDHAGDLPGFVKSRDLSTRGALRFQVVGPAAGGAYPSTTDFVEKLFGVQGAFRYLPAFRNELRFSVVDVPATPRTPSSVVEAEGLTVTALPVDHGEVPALAFRVTAGGHSLVFTGDLNSQAAEIITLARDADVLIYDAAVLDPPAAPEVLYTLHTTPRRIGEVAQASGARRVVLSHLTPSVEKAEAAVRASVRVSYPGPVDFAVDCLRLTP